MHSYLNLALIRKHDLNISGLLTYQNWPRFRVFIINIFCIIKNGTRFLHLFIYWMFVIFVAARAYSLEAYANRCEVPPAIAMRRTIHLCHLYCVIHIESSLSLRQTWSQHVASLPVSLLVANLGPVINYNPTAFSSNKRVVRWGAATF